MGFHFANVLVFAASAIGFCLVNLLVGAILRPRFPTAEKSLTYECGEVPTGEAWFNFNPRFYVIALIFVIFEVEIALMLPVALVYRSWVQGKAGGLAFAEVLSFTLILVVGLVWAWAQGDLEWIKRIGAETPALDVMAAAPLAGKKA
ncbi:MAG: NADH-quinone oxidoreductase subunit A [Deltaproteobacteria bacterium]